MITPPPSSTPIDTRIPYTTLFRAPASRARRRPAARSGKSGADRGPHLARARQGDRHGEEPAPLQGAKPPATPRPAGARTVQFVDPRGAYSNLVQSDEPSVWLALIKNDRIRSPPLSTLVSCHGRRIVKPIVPPTSDCSRFLLHYGTPWTCGAAVLSIGRNGIVQVETFDHIIIGGGFLGIAIAHHLARENGRE